MKLARLLLAFLAFLPTATPAQATAHPLIWVASWYGPGFAGKPMANGKPFNPADCSIAANRTFRSGTKLVVWNRQRGTQARWLRVTVQDYGPFKPGRQLDLSMCAARHLGYLDRGVTKLAVYIVHH